MSTLLGILGVLLLVLASGFFVLTEFALVTVDRKTVASVEYLADNKSDHDKTLVIEHPIRAGWKLSSSQKPVETTPALYRFQGTASAHKTTSLVVNEELLRSESYLELAFCQV